MNPPFTWGFQQAHLLLNVTVKLFQSTCCLILTMEISTLFATKTSSIMILTWIIPSRVSVIKFVRVLAKFKYQKYL